MKHVLLVALVLGAGAALLLTAVAALPLWMSLGVRVGAGSFAILLAVVAAAKVARRTQGTLRLVAGYGTLFLLLGGSAAGLFSVAGAPSTARATIEVLGPDIPLLGRPLFELAAAEEVSAAPGASAASPRVEPPAPSEQPQRPSSDEERLRSVFPESAFASLDNVSPAFETYDVRTGKRISRVETADVEGFARFTPDGEHLLSYELNDGTLTLVILSVATGARVAALSPPKPPRQHELPLSDVQVSSDGKTVLVVTEAMGALCADRDRFDPCLRLAVLSLPSGKVVWEKPVPEALFAAALSRDGARIAVGGRLRVLDAATGAVISEEAQPKEAQCRKLAFRDDGVVHCLERKGITTFNPHTRGSSVLPIEGTGRSLAPDGRTALVSRRDGALDVIDVETGQTGWTVPRQDLALPYFSPRGDLLFLATRPEGDSFMQMEARDAATGAVRLKTLTLPGAGLTSLSADGSTLVFSMNLGGTVHRLKDGPAPMAFLKSGPFSGFSGPGVKAAHLAPTGDAVVLFLN